MKKLIVKFLFFVLYLSFGFSFAFALTVEEIVPEKYLSELKENGMIYLSHSNEDLQFSMIPVSSYKETIENSRVEKNPKNIPFVAEFLYYVPKTMIAEKSGTESADFTIQDVSVVFRSISKMVGMKYHEGKETLYKKSYTIANPDSNDPIPDMIEGNADGRELYCYQKDNTYGDTKYRLNYKQNETELLVTFVNLLPFGIMGIYPCPPGAIKMNILAIDCGDSFVIYMSADTDCKKVALFNVRKQMEESMTDRFKAIYEWCLVQF